MAQAGRRGGVQKNKKCISGEVITHLMEGFQRVQKYLGYLLRNERITRELSAGGY